MNYTFNMTEMVSPDAITIPSRLRSSINEKSISDLVESIQRIGLQVPITVRWEREKDEYGSRGYLFLVAGLHRLEACKKLEMEVQCVIFEGTESEARLWEISENLHRSELTEIEWSQHVAEWVRITEDLQTAQLAPIESKRADGRGHRPGGGINAAVRELGINRTEAQRAVKIDGISPEGKEAVKANGLDDNQSALLEVAKAQTPEAQVQAVQKIKQAGSVAATKRNAAAPAIQQAEDSADTTGYDSKAIRNFEKSLDGLQAACEEISVYPIPDDLPQQRINEICDDGKIIAQMICHLMTLRDNVRMAIISD